MLFDKHLKTLSKAHGSGPILSIQGTGLGPCVLHHWYTFTRELQVPSLPLTMLGIQLGGRRQITLVKDQKPVSSIYSLPGDIGILPKRSGGFTLQSSDYDVVGVLFDYQETQHKLDELSRRICHPDGQLFFSPCSDPYIFNTVKHLVTSQSLGCEIDQDYIDHVMAGLEMYILKFFEPEVQADRTSATSEGRVKYLMSRLNSRLDQRIRIEDIAEELGVSPSYIGRIFKQQVGMTPQEYLLHKRLEKAKKLLSETSLSIDFISSECGFYSQSHFTRHFSNRLNISPHKYRKHFVR